MIEHIVDDEVLGPAFWNIIKLRMKMERAEGVFQTIYEYVAEILEIMEQNDNLISDEMYRRLEKVLERELLWLDNVEDRLLFWADLSGRLKNKTSKAQKS